MKKVLQLFAGNYLSCIFVLLITATKILVMTTTTIIIPRGKEFGTCNGVITPTANLFLQAMLALKAGKAELLVDTEEILMYKISA